MERLHMNYLRELVHRFRLGPSDRAIARDMHIDRRTVHKYRDLAVTNGYLDPASALPEAQVLAASLGPEPRPPLTVSTVLPYKEVVVQLLEQGVEMMTIFDRLRQDYRATPSATPLSAASCTTCALWSPAWQYASIPLQAKRPPPKAGLATDRLRLRGDAHRSCQRHAPPGLCFCDDPQLQPSPIR